MGRADFLELGSWNAVCYQCGRKRKSSMLRKHWQGYYVCPEHWEMRQPQDFVRSVPDKQTPPWVQPMPANVFLPTNYTLALADTIGFNTAPSCYMATYSDYFSGDYLAQWDCSTYEIYMVFVAVRTFTDTLPLTDGPGLTPSAVLADTISYTDALAQTSGKANADTASLVDAGSVFLADYVDATFFITDDYVGSVVSTF